MLKVPLVYEFREEAKQGPLSVPSESGSPNRLKVAIRLLIADLEVSDERESTSFEVTKIVDNNQQSSA